MTTAKSRTTKSKTTKSGAEDRNTGGTAKGAGGTARGKSAQTKAKELKQAAQGTEMWESTGTYKPKAAHTIETWEGIQKILPCTVEEMAKVEHKNPGFIVYLKRRKAIRLVEE